MGEVVLASPFLYFLNKIPVRILAVIDTSKFFKEELSSAKAFVKVSKLPSE